MGVKSIRYSRIIKCVRVCAVCERRKGREEQRGRGREKHGAGEEEREHASPATSCPACALLLVVPAVGGRGCGSRGIRHANIPVRPGSSPGGTDELQ